MNPTTPTLVAPASARRNARHNLVPEISEYWTSAQRQSHSLHEISYRACFKAELPEYFIGRFTQPDELVLDPFLGRGTTALQAHLMGRVGSGSDINPLSVMLLRPRLNPPEIREVEDRLAEIFGATHGTRGAEIPDEDLALSVFYHPKTLASLVVLKRWFAERGEAGVFDGVDDWIRMVCLNRLSGHSPGFFSVKTLPPNQAVSVESQRKINLSNGQVPEPKNIAELILKKTRSLLRSGYPAAVCRVSPLAVGDSRNLSYVEDGSVALAVTSPPFLNIVNYKKDNWLRCWFAGIDLDAVDISIFANLEEWKDFIFQSIAELCRKVKVGGHIAFEVGEVKKGTILLEDEVIEVADSLPLSVKAVMINQQKFTKTSNIWGTRNNVAGTNSNRIVLFQRERE